MEDDYEDEHAPIGDDAGGGDPADAGVAHQEGPDLFGEDSADEPAFDQDGPGLFDQDADEQASVMGNPSASDGALPPPPAREPSPVRDSGAEAAPLALYRRYRPDTFADVIGQDHVTVPLRRALENNRVNHAYLFSGPRGCGKTTSARILARCLNCEEGPTATPCGRCRSCVDLARGGPGSIDVIEIDAASHGGVDDARDLRERAYFAPVHSRYKIYIVDEAHMVTSQGFNALLKLVEEPPPHAKFVFATTEPDKVIGTIRSRTHHYPFRLVPPRTLTDYLMQICQAEGVEVEHTALPLVVRAGGGSVRDALSILDQLLGGADAGGVAYEQAAALLGYTPDALLDEIMDAFAAGDSAGVFSSIDKVIEVGQDPRRFAEDLLRRLRDLVILSAVPDAATNGMLEVSDDQAQRLATQASGMGPGELARAAEVMATGLTQMRGTTAPRLHLELMCARVLLPGADADERGLHARMDRLERRVGMMGDAPAPAPQEWEDVAHTSQSPQSATGQSAAGTGSPTARREPEPPRTQQPPEEPSAQKPAAQEPPEPASRQRPPGTPPQGTPAAEPEPVPEPRGKPVAGRLTAAELRRAWPTVLNAVKNRRRFSHMLLSQNAQVADVSDNTVVLAFTNPGARENFLSSGTQDLLIDCLIEVLGVELRVDALVTAAPHAEEQPRPAQRPAGQKVEPQRPPQTAPSPPEPTPEPEPEIGADDAELKDAQQAAAELLASEFDATIIEEPKSPETPQA